VYLFGPDSHLWVRWGWDGWWRREVHFRECGGEEEEGSDCATVRRYYWTAGVLDEGSSAMDWETRTGTNGVKAKGRARAMGSERRRWWWNK
jgi:hypothetical protein